MWPYSLPVTIPRPEDLYIHSERYDAVCVIEFSSPFPLSNVILGRLICAIRKKYTLIPITAITYTICPESEYLDNDTPEKLTKFCYFFLIPMIIEPAALIATPLSSKTMHFFSMTLHYKIMSLIRLQYIMFTFDVRHGAAYTISD